LRSSAEDFIKDSLEQLEEKKIDFDWRKQGENVEIYEYGDVCNPTMVYLDEDGDIKIGISEDYEITVDDIDSCYLAEVAFGVNSHLLNNQE
jgi:hypothetical protein